MDVDPNNFPLLSFVLSQIDPNSYPYLPPQIHQNLITEFPQLTNPRILSSLTQSIPQNLHHTLYLLKSLGPRPDPSSVSSARVKISEFEQKGVDETNTEVGIFRAVLRLDGMHGERERELRSVEESLATVYDEAVGKEVEEVVDEEVVRVLKEAESGNVVERVDLSERELRFVPEGFGKIHGLLVLNLSHNQLEVIPDAIAGLKNLQELDISSNLLVSIPDSIGLLGNLKVLNVSANKLIALPESIAGCSALRELDVSFNDLSWLPNNIGYGLTSLEKLSISLNKIRILPSSICEIKSLRYLDAHFNEIRGLPNAIGRLINLEVLNLSSNFSDLMELPETLGDLGNLRELNLSNNQIRVLPDSFYRLENLNKLNLEQNPLEVPPLEIANKGAEAVKGFMRKRWADMIAEEQLRSIHEASAAEAQNGWIGWGSSLISDFVSGVSQTVSGHMGGGKAARDPYLDQQL